MDAENRSSVPNLQIERPVALRTAGASKPAEFRNGRFLCVADGEDYVWEVRT